MELQVKTELFQSFWNPVKWGFSGYEPQKLYHIGLTVLLGQFLLGN